MGMGTERIQNGYENGNGTGTEWILNGYRTHMEWERNGHGTDREWIQNRNGTDTERIQNGYRTGNGTDTEREQERVQNGNRMHPVKRSLLGFFWMVLWCMSLIMLALKIKIEKTVCNTIIFVVFSPFPKLNII